MKHKAFLSFSFYLLIVTLLLPSCNPARKLEKGNLRKKSSSFLLKKLEQNQIEAEWFSARAKVAFAGDGQNMTATANIRMRRDSVVWLNVKKLSIEVARVQITADSVYFLNRLTQEYAVWDLGILEKRFNLPLGFADLQALILGNAVLVEKENLVADIKDNQYAISGRQASADTEYRMDGINFLLQQILISDPDKQWKVQIDQKEYGTEKDFPNFSYFRNFAIDSNTTGPIGLEINYSKIELNVPKNIEFEIPSRYTKLEQ